MSFIVSSIVGGVNEQNSILSTVCVDDWTAESAIKASPPNVCPVKISQEKDVLPFHSNLCICCQAYQ